VSERQRRAGGKGSLRVNEKQYFSIPAPVICFLSEANKFSLIPSNEVARLIGALTLNYEFL
jgi:hypothetical protein